MSAFDAKARDRSALERKIASHLERALGDAVPTFIRSPAEIVAVAAHEPFPVTPDSVYLRARFLPHCDG